MGILGFLSARKSMTATGVGSRNSIGPRSQGHSRGPYSISNPLPERADEVHSRRRSWGIRHDNSETTATETLAADISSLSSTSATPRHDRTLPPDTSLRSADTPIITKKANNKGRHVPLKKPRLVGSKHVSQDTSVFGVKLDIASSSKSDHHKIHTAHQTAQLAPMSPTLSRRSTTGHDSMHSTRGFVDILDAQDEIRPSDFRSRVQASGARDYGEDVANRNLGENGTDLSSPSVLEFYSRNGSAAQAGAVADRDELKLLGGKSNFLLRRTRQTRHSLGSRGSHSFASIAEGAATDDEETTFSSQSSHEIRRRSATAALSTTTPLSMSSNRASRGRRSRPPGMIRTDLAPFSATSNVAFVPPAIPTHTPPVSPRSLRDSIVLAKVKQASLPLARMHSYQRAQQTPSSGFSVSEESEEETGLSATPPLIKRTSRIISIAAFDPDNSPPQDEPRGRTLTRRWAVGVDGPYSPVPSPAYSHPEDFDDAALPPSVHRHWSFSSTTPTSASTCVSTPYSMYRPQSQHTADTLIEDDDADTVSPSCRTSGSSLLNPDARPTLFCTAMEARVMMPNIVSSLCPAEASVCTSGEFTLDDHLSSDELDSLCSFDMGPSGDISHATPNTPPKSRTQVARREEDADFLFRDAGHGGDDTQQLPGLFDNMPETGITTAVQQSGRPSRLITSLATNKHLFDGEDRRGVIASVFDWSDTEDEDDEEGADSEDESSMAHSFEKTREPRKLVSPHDVQKPGDDTRVDVRAALRLRKQAKTMARLTGKPVTRRCVSADNESDDADNEAHDDRAAPEEAEVSFF